MDQRLRLRRDAPRIRQVGRQARSRHGRPVHPAPAAADRNRTGEAGLEAELLHARQRAQDVEDRVERPDLVGMHLLDGGAMKCRLGGADASEGGGGGLESDASSG